MAWFKPPKWGMRLAGVWFVLTGVTALASLSFSWLPTLLAILAVAAGVLILLDR